MSEPSRSSSNAIEKFLPPFTLLSLIAATALRDGTQQKLSQFIPKRMMIDVDLVTPDNASGYYYPDAAY